MRLCRLSLFVLPLGLVAPTARGQGTCFRGPIRPACSGFVPFEGTAVGGYGGITAGADLIHGAGRTSSAAHVGLRVGSYASVAVAAVTSAAFGLLYVALSHDKS